MVLTRVIGRLALAAVLSGALVGCIKQGRAVTQVEGSLPVQIAWVVDGEGQGGPIDPPAALRKAGDQMLAARNLVPTEHLAAAWGADFARQRASSLRMSWLDEAASDAGLLALVELRPYYDNTSQGRYRWIVGVRATVAPAAAPLRQIDVQFEVPVFLRFIHQGADEAMAEASLDIVRRLSRLVDGVLQDPEGDWQLSAPEGASLRRPGPEEASESARAPRGLQGPVYFVMLDRFANGDPRNDGGQVDVSDPQGWHGGDLRGLIDHLDELHALGMRTLWLSPLTLGQRGKAGETGAFHGYWMHDPAALDPRWGSEAELVELRAALDARGMELVLDVVTNHVGYDSALPRERPSWFHGEGPITDWGDPVRAERGDVHGLPDLDQSNPEVQRWLTDAARRWMTLARPDGFRLDAVRHVSLSFWDAYNREIGKLGGPGFALLGELFDGRPDVVADVWRRGRFRQMFDFPLHYALVEGICGGQHLGKIGATLSLDRLYDRPAQLVTFLDNHDLPRVRSVCGEEARVWDALAVQFGMRGVPAITYGTESGMVGEGEPENRADMRFVEPGELHRRLATVSRLREQHPALRSGRSWVLAAQKNLLGVLRVGEGDVVLVALNRGAKVAEIALPAGLPVDEARTVLGEGDEVLLKGGVVHVPPGATRWVALRARSAEQLARWVERDRALPPERVRFEVSGYAGEQLGVVGGAPELGLWQATHALRLSPEAGQWIGEVEVPRGSVLEYKLVGLGEQPVWESRANRYLHAQLDRDTARLRWEQGG